MRTGAAIALAAALALACSPIAVPPGSPTPRAVPSIAMGEECRSAEGGYAIRAPAGWWTNAPEDAPPCSYFHPEEFEIGPGVELRAAVRVSMAAFPFEQASSTEGLRVLSEERLTVAGRPALRREAEAVGDPLVPAGTRVYTYYVEAAPGRTLIAATSQLAEADYEGTRAVLDAMMATLQLE
ncbi:MAG: hypothetical protein ACRDGE_02670 [Candidatus Limnocylindria bacterium]